MSVVIAGRRETILLAEDDDDHRWLAADVLRDSGFTVIEAVNGRAALDHLLNASRPPDVILTDLNMPVMTGWELITIARSHARFANVPIVLVTSDRVTALACDEQGPSTVQALSPRRTAGRRAGAHRHVPLIASG